MTTAVRKPPHRSAFTAAFLSFLFPGLGQAYAGAYLRAVILAVPPVIALLVTLVFFFSHGAVYFGLWIGQTSVLGPLAIVDVVILAYRAAASIDAYRLAVVLTGPVTAAMPAAAATPETDATLETVQTPSMAEILETDTAPAADATPIPPVPTYSVPSTSPTRARGFGRIGRRPGQLDPLSIMGLVMLLVVMVAGHTIVGYWDIRFYNLARDIHQDVVIETPSPDASDTPEPTITFPPQETIAPAATVKPWSGTDRLNILLVGADTRSGYRTDSTIVVSIDPVTHQVAMFSILRDALGLPMPPKSRLSQCFGTNFNEILTNLWERAEQRCKSLFPHGGSDALKQALGYTFFGNQNAIQYYIAVSFSGFEKIVDTLGGVTINVPAPVVDDTFPSNTSDHIHVRVYVPAGIQHMDGNQALTYSRMGHATFGSSNYLRAQRQQQVVVAIEQQVNFDEISSNLSSLVDTLGSTVKTDIPEGPDVLAPLINLARTVKQSDIRAIVWAGSRPNYATIRATVKSWLTPSKASSDLQAALGENAPILVQNGTGIANQDTSLASFLQGMGLNAQASAEQPAQLGGPLTILCLNGAETEFPATLTELKATLGLTGTPSTDPTSDVRLVTKLGDPVQFVVVTGTGMPALTTPPG